MSATNPRVVRPRMPKTYGLPETAPDTDAHPWSEWEAALERSKSYWISTVRADGRPHAMPVWGIWIDGALMFSTGRRSLKGRNLARSPEVIAHLESGDDVVVLEGAVEEGRDAELLGRYVEAYEAKYKFRPDPSAPDDVTYVLRPRVALTWLERDFVESATRWEFA
jgi:hypothetical protein